MTNVHFISKRAVFAGVAFAAACCLFVGCGDSEIKTYRLAKDDSVAKPHSADDGHDHHADDGHNHGPERDDSARAPNAAALPKLTWETPKGWEALPSDGIRKAHFRVSGPGDKTAQVMIIPLQGAADIDADSVNMWRQELGLDPLRKDDALGQAESVQLGDAKGNLFDMATAQPRAGEQFKTRTLGAIAQRKDVLWFAKMTGTDDLVATQKQAFVNFLKSLKFEEPAPGEAAATPAVASTNTKRLPAGSDTPDWKAPAHWQQKAPGPMITAAYNVTGSEGQADITISKFPGDVGGLVANVNRWRLQLSLPELAEAELRQSVEMLEVDGKKNSYSVDLKGTNARSNRPARMVAVAVPRAGETWFYKLMGDDSLVAREKDTFLKFVLSAY